MGQLVNVTEEDVISKLPTTYALRVSAVLLFICIAVNMVADAFITAVIMKNSELRVQVVYIFVASMCINEILDCTTATMSTAVSYLFPSLKYQQVFCGVQIYTTIILTGGTYWHMALISFHRFFVVCFNSAYKRVNRNFYLVSMLLLARLIPSIPLPFVWTRNISMPSEKIARCQYRGVCFSRVIFSLQAIVPSFVIVACYLLIVLKVYLAQSAGLAVRTAWSKHHKALYRVFATTYLLVFLGFLPYSILRMLDTEMKVHGNVYIFLYVVLTNATCFSPVIYCVMDTKFRRTLHKAMVNMFCESQESSSTPETSQGIPRLFPDSASYPETDEGFLARQEIPSFLLHRKQSSLDLTEEDLPKADESAISQENRRG